MLTSVVFTIGIIYWCLSWLTFALWMDLLAWDMPLEGYIIKRFGYDMAIAGVYWFVMYFGALIFVRLF